MKTVTLNKTRFKNSTTINHHGVECHVSKHEDLVLGQLTYELEAVLWSKHETPYVYTTYATWKDNLKDTFPSWLKKYFKINKVTHSLDVKTIYPNLNLTVPDSYDNTMVIYVNDQRIGMMKPETDPYGFQRPNFSV